MEKNPRRTPTTACVGERSVSVRGVCGRNFSCAGGFFGVFSSFGKILENVDSTIGR